MAFNQQFQEKEDFADYSVKIFPRYAHVVSLLNLMHDVYVELDKPQETAVENFSSTVREAVAALKDINGHLAGRLEGGFDGLKASLRLQDYPTAQAKEDHQRIFYMLYNALTALEH